MRRTFVTLALAILAINHPVLAQSGDEADSTVDEPLIEDDSSEEEVQPPAETEQEEPAEEASGLEHPVERVNSLLGPSGLFHLITADSMPVGSFAIGLYGQAFRSTDVARQGDENARFVGHLTIAWRPIEYVEAFFSLSGRGNSNNFAQPELIQSLGDLVLGAKAGAEVTDGLHVSGLLSLMVNNAANSVGLDFASTSVDIRALAS
ncbi:MAG: hypothetical protein KC561_01415, partial [Myxococcales bacterium]|nr:hypothetical protein [Myxococcales bacterium]